MKNIKRYIYIYIIGFVGLASCTSDFEDINTDPNNAVKVTKSSVMLYSQRSITHTLLDDNNIFTMMEWVQFFGRTNFTEQVYDYNWNTDQTYNNVYYALENMKKLEELAIEDGAVNYEAVAKIMMAWTYLNFTELHGDIPFSQALKGETDRILHPVFDAQSDIYTGLIAMLKDATSLIDVDAVGIDPESDIYCGGNMLKWEKFANTLLARTYLRISGADDATAKAGLEELFGDATAFPMLESNSDNVGVKYPSDTESSNKNWFVGQARESDNLRAVSSLVVDMLCANDDPRRTIFLNPTQESVDSVDAGAWTEYVYTGAPSAVMNPMTGFSRRKLSTVGEAISYDWFRPVDVITYAELMFIQAEAAAKGYNVGVTAQTAYEAGIDASMSKWGVTDNAAVATYKATTFASFNSAKAVEQIVTQRYLDAFHQAVNVFALIRRSGYPVLNWARMGFVLENGYPDRMPYAFNQRGNPDFERIDPSIIQNLWGENNLWFSKNTTVSMAPTYVKPAEYTFVD